MENRKILSLCSLRYKNPVPAALSILYLTFDAETFDYAKGYCKVQYAVLEYLTLQNEVTTY
jgi:hypothetical protein